ncbi:hypothetical protein ACFWGP_09935 [Agromyces sp. NPDC127015]|uniref:hypothetical protein n=1 Tax=Agromyces sp. NPDC127015 TaxID=3347108 RepID=UPI00364CC0EA
MFFGEYPTPDERALAIREMALGFGCFVVATIIALVLGARWWQALLIALPTLGLPLWFLSGEEPGYVWIALAFGFVTLAIGGVVTFVRAFPPPDGSSR